MCEETKIPKSAIGEIAKELADNARESSIEDEKKRRNGEYRFFENLPDKERIAKLEAELAYFMWLYETLARVIREIARPIDGINFNILLSARNAWSNCLVEIREHTKVHHPELFKQIF